MADVQAKKAKKVYKKMPLETSVEIRLLYQRFNVTLAQLVKDYPQYPKTTIYRHATRKALCPDKRKENKGRPRKLDKRDTRAVLRGVKKLTKEVGTFSSFHVQTEAGLEHVSNKTIRRCMKQNGLGYYQCRKKGQLTDEDLKKRVSFAKKCKQLPKNFWKEGISFYLDGASWAHKTDPYKAARTQRTRMWRKKAEGLKKEYTAKGKKEGTGGRVARFIVAIAYGKGVIKCVQYDQHINGELFAELVEEHFPEMFRLGNNDKGRLFLQDGDPSQNSAAANDAMDTVPCRVFKIPPRSPDLNPIENIFHLVGKQLHENAWRQRITKETFQQFSRRIRKTLMNFPVNTIDRTIDSMDKRLNAVLAVNGQRTKY